jgi:hypothetical protein
MGRLRKKLQGNIKAKDENSADMETASQIMPNLTHEINPLQHFMDFSMNEINS